MEFLSKNVEETKQIAHKFVQDFLLKKETDGKALVVGLYGNLGSGKTTFMKYLAECFGVEETIQSPTFVIMKIYKTSPQLLSLSRRGAARNEGGEVFDRLVHIDAYRIEKDEEMVNLGWNEIISDSKNIICVEWPEKIGKIMPGHFVVKFEHVSENERKIGIA